MADKKRKTEAALEANTELLDKLAKEADTSAQPIEQLQGKDIDQRMADLLKDHKRMGAR